MPPYYKLLRIAALEAENLLGRRVGREVALQAGGGARPFLSAAAELVTGAARQEAANVGLPSAARTLAGEELGKLALTFREAVPDTMANFSRSVVSGKIQSPLSLTGVRDLTMHLSDASLAWQGTTELLTRRATLATELSQARYAIPYGIPRSLVAQSERSGQVAGALRSNPEAVATINRYLATRQQLAALDSSLAELASSRVPGFQSAMRPKFAELGLPNPKVSSAQARLGAQASYSDGQVVMGGGFFLTPLKKEAAGLGVHELTHLEQFYLILCRESDKLGIRGVKASPAQLDALMERLAVTGTYTRPTAERFLRLRAGNELSSAAAERADKLMDSVAKFMKSPVGQLEVEEQFVAIGKFRDFLCNKEPPFMRRSLINTLHDPVKGANMAKSVFGSAEGEAQRRLILAEMPKSELTLPWTAAKDAKAVKVLDSASAAARGSVCIKQHLNFNRTSRINGVEAGGRRRSQASSHVHIERSQ